MRQFTTFGPDHLITLLIVAGLSLVVIFAARRWTVSKKSWLGRILGSLLLGYVLVIYSQKGTAGELSWQYSLPLELCHWVLFACAFTLFRPNQLGFEISYYWGFAGTLQATLTPDIAEGFPSWEFVQFFWAHAGILLAIVFFLAVERFRPRTRSVLRMLLAVNAYAVIVGILDWIFGWNYGYLCLKPVKPSLLDYLGPWPWYLVSLELIALASFLLLDLPWRWGERDHRGGANTQSGKS